MFEYPLNKEQKQAIEHIRGPLLIVAGAGTGKTTVITNKIAYLLEQKLAKPSEILALAFNDQAAEEINSRVDALVNTSYSDITIATFHSFCQRILEAQAIDIGLSNQFKILNTTAAWLLVRENLDQFNLDYYRPVGNPTKHIHDFLNHFSKCKDELISPAEYLKFAESLRLNSDIPLTGKTPKRKAKKVKSIEESKEDAASEVDRLSELANAYHYYNQLLLDRNSLDFGDLIYYTYQLFKTRPNILEQYQRRYKYILVDEFQDVNWAQYSLVKLLAAAGSELTLVGDDDQSIYAFRGASVSNILRFKDDFPKATEIVLNANYRSGQEILDLAYRSIQNNNPDRLEAKLKVNKKLIASGSEKLGEVVHLHLATQNDEAKAVAEEIKRLKTIDPACTWDDFAVLVRANNQADNIMTALESESIPYEFLAASGLFRQPIIIDCLAFFSLVANHQDSNAIFRLLRLPFLKFSENDLQKFTSTTKRKAYSYYEALKRVNEYGLSEASFNACQTLINLIHEGLKNSRFHKPTVLLYNFLESSGYLKYLKEQEELGDRKTIRQSYQLKEFFDYLENYEKITPDPHVVKFMQEYADIADSGERGALNNFTDTPDSVNIMTVHKSKGLEYKYVFIVNLVEDRFPTRTKNAGIEIPLPLIHEQLPEGDSHYQEERRLFYVAMTRAKKLLYLTSASDYGGVRSKKISRFLAELGFAANGDFAAKPKLNARLAPLSPPNQTIVYELPKTFSFSHIQTYETCPYKYKLTHVLNLPRKGSHYFSFGTSIHNTLQSFYERVKQLNATAQPTLFTAPSAKTTEVQVPSLEELIKIYESKWIDEWYPSPKEKAKYYEKGKDILKTFYASQTKQWNIPLALESFFKIKIGDHLLSGRIDRVDNLVGGGLEIIDYKTGKPKKSLTSDDKEQLLIYQIAAAQAPDFKAYGVPQKLTYYYLEDDSRASFIGTDEDLDNLNQHLANVIASIQEQNFTATPSAHNCDHCEFRDICEFRI